MLFSLYLISARCLEDELAHAHLCMCKIDMNAMEQIDRAHIRIHMIEKVSKFEKRKIEMKKVCHLNGNNDEIET